MTFHKFTTDTSDQTCFRCGVTLPIGYYIVGDTTKYCPECHYQIQRRPEKEEQMSESQNEQLSLVELKHLDDLMELMKWASEQADNPEADNPAEVK